MAAVIWGPRARVNAKEKCFSLRIEQNMVGAVSVLNGAIFLNRSARRVFNGSIGGRSTITVLGQKSESMAGFTPKPVIFDM